MNDREGTSPTEIDHRIGPLITLAIVFALVIWGLVEPESLGSALSDFAAGALAIFDTSILSLGWFVLFLIIAICVTPIGGIRIGNGPPAFSRFAFIAMVFSGAQGGALVTWSVYQPAAFYLDIPLDVGQGTDYISTVVAYTAFHWSAPIYAIWGIAAVFVVLLLRNKTTKEHSITSAVDVTLDLEHRPSVSLKQRQAVLTLVDILCIFALLFAFAANMAIIGKQVAAGLAEQLVDTPFLELAGEGTVILLISSSAGLISILGLHKGIARFARANVFIGFGMLLVIFALTFSTDLLAVIGGAVLKLAHLSVTLPLDLAFSSDEEVIKFRREWASVNYLWSFAYISLFIPFYIRIGMGRTLREFILVTSLVPSVTALLWLGVFGGGALVSPDIDLESLTTRASAGDQSVFYTYLNSLPFSEFFTRLALLILMIFAITTYAPLIYELAATVGKGNKAYLISAKVFWSISFAVLAIIIAGSPSLKVVLQFTSVGAYGVVVVFLLVLFGAARLLINGARSRGSETNYDDRVPEND